MTAAAQRRRSAVSYQGERLEIALNAAYVMDVLQVLECPTVELQLRDGNIADGAGAGR